jgi:hypothetical protein
LKNATCWLYFSLSGLSQSVCVPLVVLKDFRFRKVVKQGYAGAQYSIGVMYDKDYGVQQGYKVVAEWFQKVADQGNADA